jgi:hypothetical protein
MSLREGPEAGLPTTHYFLSLSPGDAVQTVMVRRTNLGDRSDCSPPFARTAFVTAYLALHDDLMRTVVARQAEMAKAYESRLAGAGRRGEEVASLRALDRT